MPRKEISDARLAKGLCVNCGKQPHLPNLKYCDLCRTKASQRNKSYKNNLKALGLCAMGCKRPAVPDHIYCDPCSKQIASSQRRLAKERVTAGACADCGSQRDREGFRCSACLAILAAIKQARKDRVFDQYGGYICGCCGETMVQCLQIDHIDNNGASHRMSIGGPSMTGDRFYRWLIHNQFPPGFQVLCANCNLGKMRNKGVCPHAVKPQPVAVLGPSPEPVPHS